MTRIIFYKELFHVSHPHPFLDLLKKYPSVYKYAKKVLKYIPKEELFLTRLCYHEPVKEWSAKEMLMGIFRTKNPITEVTIIHAPNADPGSSLKTLSLNEKYYQNWYILSYVGIPISLLFTIVPGPNVVLLYNLFRLYSYKHSCDGLVLLKTAVLKYKQDDFLESSTFKEICAKYDIE
eukprot:NODE_994_length_2441_cov_0.146456.p2 type:complete len:178 gc:universal NODE_994_length_2441_cov_0.146456:1753-2286(+)